MLYKVSIMGRETLIFYAAVLIILCFFFYPETAVSFSCGKTAGQDALYYPSLEGYEDRIGLFGSLQPWQNMESLLDLLD